MAAKKRKEQTEFGVDITPKGIWIWGKEGYYLVANFGLKLRYHISDSRGEVLWQVAVLDGTNEVNIELSHHEFAAPTKFHAALLKKGYVFKGDAFELNAIKEFLIGSAKKAQRVEILGQHSSGLYFFANGALTPDGQYLKPNEFQIIEYQDQAYYLPFSSTLHLKQFRSVARFVYAEPNPAPTFDVWVKAFAGAYGQKESLIPLAYYAAALFRDVAFQKKHFFPILYFEGMRGSGKSVRARSLTSLFGFPQAEVNLMSPNTPKSLPRLLEQMSNAVLWFDEYRNDLPPDIRAMLQAAYDGGGYHKANITQDNTTSSIEILSGLVLTANEIPSYDVFLSRCIVQHYNQTQKTDEQKTHFDALRLMEEQGLSVITAFFLRHRKLILEKWAETYEELSGYWRKTTERVDTRVIENLAMCLTPLQILSTAKRIDLKSIFGLDDCKEIGRDACLLNQSLLVGKSDLTIFFDILATGIETRKLRFPIDLKIVQRSKKLNKKAVALRLYRCVNYYQKELRATQNRLGLGRVELETLLRQHPAFLTDTTPVHFISEQGSDCPSNAWAFDFEVLTKCYNLAW